MSSLAGLVSSNVLTSNVLAPVLALLPVAATGLPMTDPAIPGGDDVALVASSAEDGATDPLADTRPLTFAEMAEAVRQAERAGQVRIEQRVIIRVAPAAPAGAARRPTIRDLRSSFFDFPRHSAGGSRLEERRMSQCVPVSSIAGVKPESGRLVLFMRDQRIVSASLEKACNARDFYSGFLVERSIDGMICAGRDRLLSRSGSNCALGKLKQLVAVDDEP